MHSFSKIALRTSVAAALVIGLTTSALARPAVNRVFLNCNHEDTLSNFILVNGQPIPRSMALEVAGAGWGTQMRGIVVCVSQEYAFSDGEGSATFKLRDSSGDVLVYKTTEIATWPTPGGPHYAAFAGKYVVDTAKCTGRYAGATGEGYIEGWADNDGVPAPALLPDGTPCLKGAGHGFAEMTGILILKKPACRR